MSDMSDTSSDESMSMSMSSPTRSPPSRSSRGVDRQHHTRQGSRSRTVADGPPKIQRKRSKSLSAGKQKRLLPMSKSEAKLGIFLPKHKSRSSVSISSAVLSAPHSKRRSSRRPKTAKSARHKPKAGVGLARLAKSIGADRPSTASEKKLEHSASNDSMSSPSQGKRKKRVRLLSATKERDTLRKWREFRLDVSDPKVLWTKKVEAFEGMASMLTRGDILKVSLSIWKKEVKILTVALTDKLATNRTTLFIAACDFLLHMGTCVGRKKSFQEALCILLPVLFSRHYVTVKLIRDKSLDTVLNLIPLTHSHKIIDTFYAAADDKHKQVRASICTYLAFILEHYHKTAKAKTVPKRDVRRIKDILVAHLRDPGPNVRKAAKNAVLVLELYGVDPSEVVLPKRR